MMDLNEEKKVLIIAEAGVNHNGSLETAKKMAKVAKESGADIVKYQTADLNSLVSKHANMANYQIENTGSNSNQKEMLRNLLLSYSDFTELSDYCREIGIVFLSTPFDIKSINFLEELGCDIWKIPSGEITNFPYLERIAKLNGDVILSTGMSNMDEVGDALSVLRKYKDRNITLMHCTTQYPAPYESVNLNAMLTLKKEFGCKVGYSDHTKGIEVAVAAVALGATIIEKHFTLSREMSGPDHKASLEPLELKQMIEAVRNIEKSMGDGVKRACESEIDNISVARKSIIASRYIKKGEKFTEENLTTKRPGNGLSPMKWFEVIGKIALRDFDEDEIIEI